MTERIIQETWFRIGDLWDSLSPRQRNNLIDGSALGLGVAELDWKMINFSTKLKIHDYIINTRKMISKTFPDIVERSS